MESVSRETLDEKTDELCSRLCQILVTVLSVRGASLSLSIDRRLNVVLEKTDTRNACCVYAGEHDPLRKKDVVGFLRDYELSFRPQKVIGNYIVDFYCRKVKLSIEIDGDSHFEKRSLEYDSVRTIFLSTLEIHELRFTNTQVHEEFEGVCEFIDSVVKARRNDFHSISLDEVKRKG